MRKPQLEKLQTGLTGEYMVAGMMNLKGWVASLTLKNYPSVDIFGLNPKTGEKISIQVKTSRGTNFFIGYKRSQRTDLETQVQGPYVFVHINVAEELSYYILITFLPKKNSLPLSIRAMTLISTSLGRSQLNRITP